MMWKAEGLLVKPGFDEAGRCPIHENTIQNIKAEGLLVNPGFDEAGRDPTNMNTIRCYQQRNDTVKQLKLTNPNEFGITNLNGTDVICKYESDDDFCLVLCTEMLEPLIRWHHTVAAHATGAQTLLHTMKRLLPVPMQTTQGPTELEPLLHFMVPPNDTTFAKSHLLVSLQSSLPSPFIPSQS